MCWHHRMCEYANYPHSNIIPKMPTRKKTVVEGGGEMKESGEQEKSGGKKEN